jgi:hypothetical protein
MALIQQTMEKHGLTMSKACELLKLNKNAYYVSRDYLLKHKPLQKEASAVNELSASAKGTPVVDSETLAESKEKTIVFNEVKLTGTNKNLVLIMKTIFAGELTKILIDA